MSRIRLILLSLLAVFAVSAVASASASAVACGTSKEGGDVELCIEGTESEGSFPITGSGGTTKLETTGLGTIECDEVLIIGKSEGTPAFDAKDSLLELSNFGLEFKGHCKLVGSPLCTIEEPIIIGGTDGLDGTFPTPKEGLFKPSEGTMFGTIVIKTCGVLNGSYKITGEQACKLPGSETEATEHEVECLGSESKLKVGGKAAKFTGTVKVKLVSGKKYSLKAS